VRNQLDIFDHDPARMAEANRAAAEHALTDVQFTAAIRKNAMSITCAKQNAGKTSQQAA